MNCHENNKENQGTHNHSPLKHVLHMIICCGLPIVVLAFLPAITKFSPGTGRIVSVIAPFLCPVMMILMMFMMCSGSKKKNCCENKDEK